MPASISTPAPTSDPAPAAAKVGLRRKGATLQGVRAITAQVVTLPDGTPAPVRVGDWLILQGSYVLAVCPPDQFPGPTYEVVAEGTLLLTVYDRVLIETAVGVGATQTGATLISAVQRLARIRIGDVTIPFTPGQMEELKHRAEKRGQTVQQAVQAVVDRIKDEIFWRG